MADQKSSKGYLSQQYMQVGILPSLRAFFDGSWTPPFLPNEPRAPGFYPPETRQQFSAASLNLPIHVVVKKDEPPAAAKPLDDKAIIDLTKDAQRGLVKFGYKGKIEGDWGSKTGAAFQALVDFAQNSSYYEDFIKKGALTKNGTPLTKDHTYGSYTQQALEALANDGKLGDIETAKKMVEAIRRLKNPEEPLRISRTIKINTDPVNPPGFTNTRLIVWGDSIARALPGFEKNFKSVTNCGVNGAGIGGGVRPMDFENSVLKNCRGAVVELSEATNIIMGLKTDNDIRKHADILAARAQSVHDAGGLPLVFDVRQIAGVYKSAPPGPNASESAKAAYANYRKTWKLDESPEAQQALVDQWNKTAVRLNEELAKRLGDNFIRTDGKVKIGADNLHPEISAAGFGTMTTLAAEQARKLGVQI